MKNKRRTKVTPKLDLKQMRGFIKEERMNDTTSKQDQQQQRRDYEAQHMTQEQKDEFENLQRQSYGLPIKPKGNPLTQNKTKESRE
jgi:hypothetical protein